MDKKPPARYLQTLHVYSRSKQREHDVLTKPPRRFNTKHTQCIYRVKTIIQQHNKGEPSPEGLSKTSVTKIIKKKKYKQTLQTTMTQ